jgi:dTDP-4-dehydrorhamnose 3,5-epimerase
VIFTALELSGAYVIDPERRRDDRGYFARTWCVDELAKHGLDSTIVQINTGWSAAAGTLRGMHLQTGAHAEVKVMRCTRGAVLDVIIDLRRDSPTFCRSHAVELSAENGRMLYAPKGFAHGYQTLVDGAELLYSTSAVYAPDSACGVRYDDPRFGIRWLLPVSRISDQDRGWPDFGPGHPAFEAR